MQIRMSVLIYYIPRG